MNLSTSITILATLLLVSASLPIAHAAPTELPNFTKGTTALADTAAPGSTSNLIKAQQQINMGDGAVESLAKKTADIRLTERIDSKPPKSPSLDPPPKQTTGLGESKSSPVAPLPSKPLTLAKIKADFPEYPKRSTQGIGSVYINSQNHFHIELKGGDTISQIQKDVYQIGFKDGTHTPIMIDGTTGFPISNGKVNLPPVTFEDLGEVEGVLDRNMERSTNTYTNGIVFNNGGIQTLYTRKWDVVAIRSPYYTSYYKPGSGLEEERLMTKWNDGVIRSGPLNSDNVRGDPFYGGSLDYISLDNQGGLALKLLNGNILELDNNDVLGRLFDKNNGFAKWHIKRP